MVDGFFEVFYAETVGSLSLGVNVNEKDLFSEDFQSCAEVDGCSCFSDASFVVCDGYYSHGCIWSLFLLSL